MLYHYNMVAYTLKYDLTYKPTKKYKSTRVCIGKQRLTKRIISPKISKGIVVQSTETGNRSSAGPPGDRRRHLIRYRVETKYEIRRCIIIIHFVV